MSRVSSDAADWGAGRRGMTRSQGVLPFGPPADPTAWGHPDIGYGVLIADTSDGSKAADPDKALGRNDSVPEAVRRNLGKILAKRPETVVLRWLPELGNRKVRRYFADLPARDPEIGLTPFGIGADNLPQYVLIVGGPTVIPWSVQYAFGVRHAVGRLPFTDERLDGYIDAMLAGWPDADLNIQAPVIWTVDHGSRDITRLMRQTITSRLEKSFTGTLTGMTHLDDQDATSDNFLTRLTHKGQRPALVITSSHGSTPFDDQELAATLGLPVDPDHAPLPIDDLEKAMPAGAVWFAQACCSAGGAGESLYEGLLPEASKAFRVTRKVASLGPVVAPAPLRLLGREKPVRAVIGHVEPTFDWTLKDPQTRQVFGDVLVTALSTNLHHGQPVGYAFNDYGRQIGVLNSTWARLRDELGANDSEGAELLTRYRLTALDRQSLVLLGDPTVVLPAVL